MTTTFTLSHFLRRSGEVLEATDAGDVILTRRDGDDLRIETVRRAEAWRTALEILAELVLEALTDEGVARELTCRLPSAVRWTSVLSDAERERLIRDIARLATEAIGHGSAQPLVHVLDQWRRAARSRAERPPSAHLSRPVAIPDDVDDPTIEKASGVVELPLRVRWSYPKRAYDLADPRQLRRVYEQVLREGTDEDVRHFIDVDALIRHWDDLVLPPNVRRKWADWLRDRRRVTLAC